jgi:hypothetical protein
MAPHKPGWTRWLIPIGALMALIGYFGPWVNHPAAGLAILGLDLGEYVKFLIPVRSGAIEVWREGFYLPLLAVSLTLSLFAFRREQGWGWPMRIALLGLAIVAALNMLPPAWSPAVVRTGEFRTQVIWIGLCLAAVLFSPFLALLPGIAAATISVALAAIAAILAPMHFVRVLPAIEELYRRDLSPGWGMWVMIAGLVVMAVGAAIGRR